MQERRLRSAAKKVLRLGVVATMVSFGVLTLSSGLMPPLAEASVAADRKDEGKEKKESKKHDDDKGEDFVLNGQVLEINTQKDPPEMVVGTVDGPARVRVLKTDEIARNGVAVGDSVELTGEKINEQLFEATEISVSERSGGSGANTDARHHADDSDNDNSDDDSE
jgi:hypothetical protein